MRFYERQARDFCSKIFGLRFKVANGQERVLECSITQQAAMDNPQMVQYAQEKLQRQAQREIQQSMEVRQMPTNVYGNAYLDNTTGWLGIAGGTLGGAIGGALTATTTTATAYQQPYYNEYADNAAQLQANPQWYTTTATWNGNDATVQGWGTSLGKIKIKYRDGRRELIIEKDYGSEIEITPEDIVKARMDYIKNARINIISRRAETKAEELLKMLVSEVDFRNYKEKGYFTVRNGNKIYRIWKDSHKFIDCFERTEQGIIVPHNRLCTHTLTRELPKADEAVQKLMLIRSNRVFEHSNLHGVCGMEPIEAKELAIA